MFNQNREMVPIGTIISTAVGGSSTGVATGSYIGNGSSQSINVGFEPELVILRRTTETPLDGTHWKGSHMHGNTSKGMSRGRITSGITAFTSTGFDIGSDSEVNSRSDVYHYIALRTLPVMANTFIPRSYLGDGTTTRTIGT